MRKEKDIIGETFLPDNALYGINSIRAKENFPDNTAFHIEWYQAIGLTKKACYLTYKKFKQAVLQKFVKSHSPISLIEDEILNKLIECSQEIADGMHFENFIVPAIQGGAGTSINMNINEIISNLSLKKLNKSLGCYSFIDPFEHANIYQSTNDIIPTSLTIAVIQLLVKLEDKINKLRFEIEKIEQQNRDTLRIGYTQMQEAVPSSYGKLFSNYNDALSRDWWRVSKCFERIKTVNLGAGAIGTALSVPRFYVMNVVSELQKITNLPITRSENLTDATSNLDSFVEVHGILKSHAVNLEKMVNDIRLLSSDLVSNNEITIPQKQIGSSIMPSKTNPVIPEFVVSAVNKIYSNDILISSLAGQGCLELNAYIPTIGHALIESIKLLIAINKTLKENLFSELKVNHQIAVNKLYYSPSIATATIPFIGYKKASEIATIMKSKKINIFEANKTVKYIDNQKLKDILLTKNLLKTGFSINDIL